MTQPEDRLQQLSPAKRALYEQRRAAAQQEPIAIVGVGLRFPGGAVDAESFWGLLSRGVDAISEVPRDRWDAEALYDPDPDSPGKMATRWGGFLDGLDRFDPEFFGMTAREATRLDPQQRLLLEVGYEALENAGIAPLSLLGSRTGVFVGLSFTDYWYLQVSDRPAIDVYTATGTGLHAGAGRLAYALGLTGPAMTVDTACSSSLVAVHLACQSLRSGETNLALAGGANVLLAPENHIVMSRMRVFAANGRCKTFDESADGIVRSEGCGLVVLERLADARAAGHPVLALVRGSAVNQDGRSAGLTVPHGPSQQALIRAALAAAGVRPEEVGYVEAHGTGTRLGDPIELQSIHATIAGRRSEPLLVGSVKTNLGHLESAAGIAGLIKTALALDRGEVPPHLHFKKMNPLAGASGASVRVPTERVPWPGPRRVAGVSAFGLIGTNAHVVMEAAPPEEVPPLPSRPVNLLLLSARSEGALVEAASRYEQHLAATPGLSAGDLCFTAALGRSHHPHRLAVVGSSLEQLRQRLESAALGRPSPGVVRGAAAPEPPRVAFLFAGQGSQYPGMGRLLYETEPAFRAAFDACARLLEAKLDRPLGPLVFESDEKLLEQTQHTQPALFALQHALAQLWRSWGVAPSAVMGHSVGELAAAVAAGALSLEDGAQLVAERGRLMGRLPPGGRMATVLAELPVVTAAMEEAGPGLAIAAINGPKSVVVSGKEELLARLVQALSARGIVTRGLLTSVAFHSPLVDPILDDLERAAASVRPGRVQCSLVSNLTGKALEGEALTAQHWRRHAREPVQFSQGVATLAGMGIDVFVEIGGHSTLLGMARACLPEGDQLWLPSLKRKRDDREQLLESLGALYSRGAAVDWAAFHRGWAGRRARLPSYPFQRRRLWIAPPPAEPQAAAARQAAGQGHPLLGTRLRTAAPVFENALSARAPSYLAHHRFHGKAVLPAAAVVEMALAAGGGRALSGLELVEPLLLPEDGSLLVQATVQEGGGAGARLEVHSQDGERWRLHARVGLRAAGEGPKGADLGPARERCSAEVDPSAYYATLASRGFDYGPSFRTIAALRRTEGECVARLALPPGVAAGGHLLHPALLDGALRALAAADPRELAEAGAAADLVPVGVESVRLARQAAAAELWCHGQFRRPGEPLTGDLRLFLPSGELVAEVLGIRTDRLARSALAGAPGEDAAPDASPDGLFEIAWRPVPAPPAVRREGRGAWLICSDAAGLGEALAERLARLGETCLQVRPGTALRQQAGHWSIDPASPGQWAELLAMEAPGVPWRGAIYLWGLDAAWSDVAEPLRAAMGPAVRAALHLMQALARVDREAPPRLYLATRGAQPAGAPGQTIALPQAPLWGLARSFGRERPGQLGCVVDLDPAEGADLASALLEAVWSSGGEDQLAYRGGQRHAARLSLLPQPGGALALRRDGAYLITGGLTGLGLEIAKWMASQGAGSLWLLGRRPPSELAQAVLNELRRSGVQVHAVQGDVSVRADLARALGAISGHPLRGVVHAAGVLENAAFLDQSWPGFERVMGPKVTGALLLHELTRGAPLDFFAMFSSAVASLALPGQASYAAANAFLDALAHHRRAMSLPAVSLAWGPWDTVGMAASSEHEGPWVRWGVETIGPGLGAELFGRLAAGPRAHVGVLRADWKRLAQVFPGGDGPIFSEVASSGGQDVSGVLEGPPGERRARLDSYLRAQLSQVLGSDCSALDASLLLSEAGVDSLLAVEVRSRLAKGLKRALPATLLLKHPTIAALEDFLEAALEGRERA